MLFHQLFGYCVAEHSATFSVHMAIDDIEELICLRSMLESVQTINELNPMTN